MHNSIRRPRQTGLFPRSLSVVARSVDLFLSGSLFTMAQKNHPSKHFIFLIFLSMLWKDYWFISCKSSAIVQLITVCILQFKAYLFLQQQLVHRNLYIYVTLTEAVLCLSIRCYSQLKCCIVDIYNIFVCFYITVCAIFVHVKEQL